MKLGEWRKEIDLIDTEIVRLIDQRLRIVKKIGALKIKAGLPICDAQREKTVLKNTCLRDRNVLKDKSIINIYKKILEESRQTQKRALNINNKEGVEVYQ